MMRGQHDFNTNLTPTGGATDEFLANRFRNSTQMLPQRPVSAPVEDGMTTMMDPLSQDDLRTALQSDPSPAAITPLRQSRGGLATPKRAGLVGATLLAAALLVYIGRGYIHEPVEMTQPTELAAPAEADQTDLAIAEIPLTIDTLSSQLIDTPPLVAPIAPAVVVVSPLPDTTIPVTIASLPPSELSAVQTDTAANNSTTASSESNEPVASQSDAEIDPVADLPAPTTETTDTPTATDEAVVAPVATTDQVADQTETATASDQTTDRDPVVADDTTAETDQAASTESSTNTVAQVEQPRTVSQQQNRRGDENRAAGEGLKVASQVLTKVAQPIANAGQAGRYFGQR